MFLMNNFDKNLFLKNVDLKKYCTMKVGGKAKLLFICKSIQSLVDVCSYCKLHNIKFKVIGFGANLIFDDNGYNGAIIVNRTNKISFKHNSAYVESGASVGNLINKCLLRNLSGIEKLAGIPSTVGGGIINSLGSFDTNLVDFVEYVECYNFNDLSTPIRINKEDCKFGYRTSIFKSGNYLITKIKFNFKYDNAEVIKSNMLSALRKKSDTQPLNYPSSGSVFKRCEIIPSKTIDELGLKGTKMGDACVSAKHAGFIVNLGNATSKDIKDLVEKLQKEVKLKTNISLETEIEFVN